MRAVQTRTIVSGSRWSSPRPVPRPRGHRHRRADRGGRDRPTPATTAPVATRPPFAPGAEHPRHYGPDRPRRRDGTADRTAHMRRRSPRPARRHRLPRRCRARAPGPAPACRSSPRSPVTRRPGGRTPAPGARPPPRRPPAPRPRRDARARRTHPAPIHAARRRPGADDTLAPTTPPPTTAAATTTTQAAAAVEYRTYGVERRRLASCWRTPARRSPSPRPTSAADGCTRPSRTALARCS